VFKINVIFKILVFPQKNQTDKQIQIGISIRNGKSGLRSS